MSILSGAEATAEDFGSAVRQQWIIENGMFYGRDVTYAEDRLHARTIAYVLAAVRNTAINFIRSIGHRYIPDGRRCISASTDYDLSLLLEH